MSGAVILPFAIGVGAGVLSGFGVGGGTLLLLYLTGVVGMEQTTAQGVNLLFFLPSALLALPSHVKHGYVSKEHALPAMVFGLLASGVTAWIATGMETATLSKWFGGFLLVIGLRELFRKETSSCE